MSNSQIQPVSKHFFYNIKRVGGEVIIGASIPAVDESQVRTILRNYYSDIDYLKVTQVPFPVTRTAV
jgi:hypothetical protein